MGLDYYAVMYGEFSGAMPFYTFSPNGMYTKAAVLDCESLSCVWHDYVFQPNGQPMLPGMPVKWGYGEGVSCNLPNLKVCCVGGTFSHSWRITLKGKLYTIDVVESQLFLNDNYIFRSDEWLSWNKTISHLLLLCDSGDGIYRFMFAPWMGGIEVFDLCFNLWIDSATDTALCYAWGVGLDKGICCFNRLSESCLKKYDRLRSRIAKSVLLRGSGRLY